MRILVACEESQAVTKEFRLLGHEAYSCDIQESSGGRPEWHLQTDVLQLLKLKWDMIIAFPPCTHLAVSGAAHFEKKRKDGRQQEGIDFFLEFAKHDCPKMAIENPIGIMSKIWREPNQIIQPWQFGSEAQKSTCLWLKGLPLLQPTNIVSKGEFSKSGYSIGASSAYAVDEKGKRIAWSDPRTAKARSKTFPGIAKAMADQWSNIKIEQLTLF